MAKATINELISALRILSKHCSGDYPTHCEHDVLMVRALGPENFTEEDVQKLGELGFSWSEENDCWRSFTFGSC